jgi:hypothetical protein
MSGAVAITGELRNKLYCINLSQLRSLEKALNLRERNPLLTNSPTSKFRNHSRCSHVGDAMLEYATRSNICHGLATNLSDFKMPLPKCVICGMAKTRRTALRRLRVQHLTELKVGTKLQVDIQGPMQVTALEGERYCTLGLDYHSDKTFIAFHDTKDASATHIQDWINREYIARGHTLQVIKCDNDKIFLSEQFRKACQQKGIRFELSQAYNPEQNSRIEKRFEYIDGLARANLINYQIIWGLANPPIKLFTYAMTYAVYISDRIRPSFLNKTISAYEAFTGERPDLSRAVPFGTLGICSTRDIKPPSTIKKLDSRGFEGVFIGFDPEHFPGYRMMTKSFPPQFYTIRNVKFDLIKNDLAITKFGEHHSDFEVDNVTMETFHNISTEYDSDQIHSDVGRDGSSSVHSQQSDSSDNESNHETRPVKRAKRDYYIPHREPYGFRRDREKVMKNMERALIWHTAYKLLDLSNVYTPTSFKQALSCPDAPQWRKGIIKEVMSQFNKDTHERVVLPSGATAIQSKWIFKVKINQDNTIQYKVRLVAQGQTQIYGIDFDETYSPVARLETTRSFFARAAQYEWIIHQMDVDTAYLNASLDHTIYMKPPQGFRAGGDILCPPEYICKKGEVLKLKKAIYGTKQAGLQWFKLLRDFILSIGYTQCKSEGCLFYRDDESGHNEILIYVDDLLIAGDSIDRTFTVKNQFKQRFEMKDLGECKRFLGINVNQNLNNHSITISAQQYIESIIKDFDMEDDSLYPPTEYPFLPEYILNKSMEPTPQEAATSEYINLKNIYRKLVGKLSYLADKVRADILTAVGTINSYTSNPGWVHWYAAIHIVRYLKGTLNLGLIFRQVPDEEFVLRCWADSNLADGKNQVKSKTGGVILLGNSLIKSISHRQGSVATSTTHAEINALLEITHDIMYFRGFFSEINLELEEPTIIYEDNQAAIALSKNPGKSNVRYLELGIAAIREQILLGSIEIEYVNTAFNIADFFTKPLINELFYKFRDALGFVFI